jgi:hypothetical protein
MGKIVFLELLDRRGNIKERVKVDSFPATVGRAYTNAVIVDDRLVSAEHLRLWLDSEDSIVVEDLNTVNGTRLLTSQERIERHRIPVGTEAVIRIGQTTLRVRGDDFAVGPVASSRPLFGPFYRYTENGVIASLAFVAGFGLNVLAYAQEIHKKVIWSDLTVMSLVLLTIFALWTGFWSFLNRLVAHSFRFMTHLGISGIASIFFLMLFTFTEYFEFFFTAPVAAEVVGFGGFAVIFSLLLYGHLSIMSEFSGRKRILSSVLMSAAIVGIVLLINYTEKKEFSDELRFSHVIKPVGRKWVRTVSSDEFFGNLNKLRATIDAMAQEGPKERTVNPSQS